MCQVISVIEVGGETCLGIQPQKLNWLQYRILQEVETFFCVLQ